MRIKGRSSLQKQKLIEEKTINKAKLSNKKLSVLMNSSIIFLDLLYQNL